MFSSAKNLTVILDAVCWKSCHIHACSPVSLLVHNEYALPIGLCSLLASMLIGNCSALRKSAVMATVANVCNTTSNFLYPHMVAIRGFSMSNFIWYSFSDCQKVTSSLPLCSPECLCEYKGLYNTAQSLTGYMVSSWMLTGASLGKDTTPLDCGADARCKARYTQKKLGLNIIKSAQPLRHLSLPSVCHCLSPTVLSFSAPSGIIPSFSLSSLLHQALACDFTNPAI